MGNKVDYYIERYNAQAKEWERLGVVVEGEFDDMGEPWSFYRTSWSGLWTFDMSASTLTSLMASIQDQYGNEWKKYSKTNLSEEA